MPENQQISPEEMKKRQEELASFYNEQIPLLKLRKEYEELQTEIQELQTRRAYSQNQLAQLMYNNKTKDNGDSKSSE
jgi:seryl-tRNA synthetase